AGASIVFQGAMHALNPVQRIGDQIAEPILLHRGATPAAARARVGELLTQVGLPAARAAAYPHELSGGQRQRVMIAMALACDPRLIVADEPTTALDVMIQAQILGLIGRLVAEQDIALLMISHDLAVLADVCDRLAVMYAGQVVEEGPARTVYSAALHPYGQALAAAFPRIGDPASRRAPRGLPGDPPDPAALPPGCAFHPRCAVAVERCAREEQRLTVFGAGDTEAVVRPRAAADDDRAVPGPGAPAGDLPVADAPPGGGEPGPALRPVPGTDAEGPPIPPDAPGEETRSGGVGTRVRTGDGRDGGPPDAPGTVPASGGGDDGGPGDGTSADGVSADRAAHRVACVRVAPPGACDGDRGEGSGEGGVG
ncbi:ABC transporter ATP-binding protein, partial [Streptomyces clavuligerus]